VSGKFTPSQVVARYIELGAKAITGTMNVDPVDGRWKIYRRGDEAPKCCALGVMMEGQKVVKYGDRIGEVKRHLDVDYLSFYTGFDGLSVERYVHNDEWVQADYELGVACRKAVDEAKLWNEEVESYYDDDL